MYCIHWIVGNITGGHLALCSAVIAYALYWMPLTDFLKVLLITTWSPSSALWQEMCIIIPRLWSWRKAGLGFFSNAVGRSKRNRPRHVIPSGHGTLEDAFLSYVLIRGAVPFVLAPALSRCCLRERTCNAGIQLSRFSGAVLPLHFIADGILSFYSLF